MSQETVERLKALLFEKESRDIDQLARQLDDLAARAHQEKGELARRLDDIADRVGGDAQLARSVSRIVDKAIAEAEVHRHPQLTEAMAPMVVRTLSVELASRHTQNQIAGMLTPRLGDMIRRFVADRMQELMDRINRGLEQNRFFMRLRSIATGRSMAELALADSERLEVEELYLIRRGSGELVHRWSRAPAAGEDAVAQGGNRDSVVAGMLDALSSFVEEAFEADKAKLRAIDLDSKDLDDRRVLLAGSPSYLVAIKCKGTATRPVMGLLDAEVLKVLAAHQQVEERRVHAAAGEGDRAAAAAEKEHEEILSGAADALTSRIAERESEIRRQRMLRPLKLLLWLVGLPLACFLAWQWWIGYQTSLLQAEVDAAVAGTAEVKGYNISAKVERGGRAVWVGGLVPDEVARQQLIQRIRTAVPEARLNESMGVLPREDVGGAVRAAALAGALDRAGLKLDQLSSDLSRIGGALASAEDRAALEAARRAAEGLSASIRGGVVAGADEALVSGLHEAIRSLTAAGDRLASLVAREVSAGPLPESAPGPLPNGATESAERLAHASDRVTRLVAMLETAGASARERMRLAAELEATRAAAEAELARVREAATAERTRLETRLGDLDQRIAALQPRPPTPRERLERLARERAVFFVAGTDYRDPAAAAAFLDEVAALIGSTDVLVRVVGYTDEAGGQQRNAPLSQSRAEKVADDLAQRGVPRSRLVAVGRATTLDLSPRTGVSSSNRRVELELGFVGEGGQP